MNKEKYKNHVCVVGSAKPLIFSSVVMTLVDVMQNESSWPARMDQINRRVHKLLKRLSTDPTNIPKESYRIGGRTA